MAEMLTDLSDDYQHTQTTEQVAAHRVRVFHERFIVQCDCGWGRALTSASAAERAGRDHEAWMAVLEDEPPFDETADEAEEIWATARE
jgi:hypothetical protein